MKKLRLIFDEAIPDDIKEYLIGLDGIEKVSINHSEKDGGIFDFEYDGNIIKPQNILKEMELYMNVINRRPLTLIGFDKYYDDIKEVTYKDPNLCCEFCYLNLVNELFFNDDVSSFKHLTNNVFKYCYKEYKDFLITYLNDKEFIDDAIKRFSNN